MGSISWVSPTVESRTLKRDRDKALAIRKVSPPFKSVVTDGTQGLPKSTSGTKANVSQMKPVANTMCEQKVSTFGKTLRGQKYFTKHFKRTKMRTEVFHKTDYADKKRLKVGQKRFLKTTLNLRLIGRLPSPLKQLDWSENNIVKDSVWARRTSWLPTLFRR